MLTCGGSRRQSSDGSLSLPTDVMDIVGTCGRDAAEAAAISAIDQALWDVIAQDARRVAGRRTLGDPRRTTIGLYANINRGTLDRSPAGFAARATEAVTSGFDAIKIAPFDGVRPDNIDETDTAKMLAAGLDRIAAVRAAIGPEVRLLVDCHWRLTEACGRRRAARGRTAEAVLAGMSGARGDRQFSRASASEEPRQRHGRTPRRMRDDDRPARFPAVPRCRRLRRHHAGREICRRRPRAGTDRTGRRRQGVACSPHNPSGPIAHAHSLHVSAHVPLLPFLEFQYGESPLFFDFVDGSLPDPRSGRSDLPQGTGLGLGLAERCHCANG